MENPFCCQLANCTMSFNDEEQLTAHKKKHELSLSLTPSSCKNPFILDQTPTPTQFLNPVSLELDDLQSDNPFEATFRKANSSSHSTNIVMPESSSFIASLPDSEVLNTPSIILPSEPATPICLKPCTLQTIKRKDNHLSENNDTLPFIQNEQTEKSASPQQSIEDAELPSESANFSGVVSSSVDGLSVKVEKDKDNSAASKNVLQTSVITSVGNTAVLKNSVIGVPTAVVVTRAPVNNIPTVSMSQVSQLKVQKTIPAVAQPLHLGTVLLSINVEPQTLLQLGGNLPAVATLAPQITSVTSIAPQVSSTSSNTKMKLKEVLTQNQKGVNIRKATMSKPRPKPPVLIQPDSDSARMSSSPPSSPIFTTRKPGHNGRRRSEIIDDPDEKKRKSLERNRAAATRCREKRKVWMKNLEKKADELAETNVHLQHEVSLLRNEVKHLKMLLLEHKDCPVTLQQKASVHEAEKETYTTVRIITSTSDDIQRVPNISVISPPSSDFMEMEMSSVQSSSDSMGSEASEMSYRER